VGYDRDIYPEPGSVPGNPSFRTQGEALEFSLAEYNSARSDMLQGLAGQQSILAWSIAAIGVLFAAGLALSPSHVDHATTIRPLIFLVGVPLVALGASFAWLGEIFRMERDAHYLRLLERSTWTNEQRAQTNEQGELIVSDSWVGHTPLLLNAWVAHRDPPGRNRVLGYLGGVIIFTGATAGSLALACALVRHNRALVIVIATAWFAGYCIITWIHVKRIMNYSKLGALEATKRATLPTSPAPAKSD
jgi:hypothetical protein